jgi:hypothetical protein
MQLKLPMKRSVAVALGALFITVLASADQFDFLVANVSLLQDKAVQKELGVSESLRTKLNKHADWFNGQMKQMDQDLAAARKKNPKAKPSGDKIIGLQKQLKSKVLAELSARQVLRLREITLQEAGLSALLDKTVADRVGLSAAQLKSLRDEWSRNEKKADAYGKEGGKIEEKAIQPVLAKYGKSQPKDKADAEKRRAEVQAALKKYEPQLKAVQEKINALGPSFESFVKKTCTTDQLSTFKTLQGPTFKGA